MISITENAEKKLRSLLKGEQHASLRVVSGPDQRLRLLINKRMDPGAPDALIQDETEALPDDLVVDVSGQDLVFKRVGHKYITK